MTKRSKADRERGWLEAVGMLACAGCGEACRSTTAQRQSKADRERAAQAAYDVVREAAWAVYVATCKLAREARDAACEAVEGDDVDTRKDRR